MGNEITFVDALPQRMFSNSQAIKDTYKREFKNLQVILQLGYSDKVIKISIPELGIDINNNQLQFVYSSYFSKGCSMDNKDEVSYEVLKKDGIPSKIVKRIKSISGVYCSASRSSWDADFNWNEEEDIVLITDINIT